MMFESISTLRHDRDIAREQALLQEAQVLEKIIKRLVPILGDYTYRIPEREINPCQKYPEGSTTYYDFNGIVIKEEDSQIVLWEDGEFGLLKTFPVWDGHEKIGTASICEPLTLKEALRIVRLKKLLSGIEGEMWTAKKIMEFRIKEFNERLQEAKEIEEELCRGEATLGRLSLP